MNDAERAVLADHLLGLADDELILAHRDAEWTGHAPILEEDIAMANIAQDELGHAMHYFRLVESLIGADPDELAFFRDAAAFRHVQLVELPKGDWAFTMTRQFLFDAYELMALRARATSAFGPLAEAAATMVREEAYHLRHTSAWVERLGRGTDESRRRMEAALETLWPFSEQLFVAAPAEAGLIAAGILPEPGAIRRAWLDLVGERLAVAGLATPPASTAIVAPRGEHTVHLDQLLADMQAVARTDPEAEW